MSTSLNPYLAVQVFYLTLAIGYNVVGLWMLSSTGEGLYHGAAYVFSIVSLPILIPVLLLGHDKMYRSFFVINTLVTLLLVVVGVMPHLTLYLDDNLQRYTSFAAWAWAIGINSFGVIVGLVASFISWKLVRESRS